MTHITFIKRVFLLSFFFLFIYSTSFAQFDSLQFGGLNRTYLLHLPLSYTGTDTIPLIIAMHGGFGNATNLQNQSLLSDKADSSNFIVVYPEGIASPLGIRTWNGGWCCGYSVTQNIDDVGFISALIDTLAANYSVDIKRVYATGMSNGGIMSFRLACELADKIAAIAPVAASMTMINCSSSRPVPIIQFHSYMDTNVPYLGGIGSGVSNHFSPSQDSVMTAWASYDSCIVFNDTVVNNNEYTFTKWTGCKCGTELHHYITHDGGHSWPGGTKTVIGDSVSTFINADDLMWDFFQQHSLDCQTAIGTNNNASENGVVIYPNPSSGIIGIDFTYPISNYRIIVMNQLGQIIKEFENKNKLDLSKEADGIYYLVIYTGNNIISKKVFIQ